MNESHTEQGYNDDSVISLEEKRQERGAQPPSEDFAESQAEQQAVIANAEADNVVSLATVPMLLHEELKNLEAYRKDELQQKIVGINKKRNDIAIELKRLSKLREADDAEIAWEDVHPNEPKEDTLEFPVVTNSPSKSTTSTEATVASDQDKDGANISQIDTKFIHPITRRIVELQTELSDLAQEQQSVLGEYRAVDEEIGEHIRQIGRFENNQT